MTSQNIPADRARKLAARFRQQMEPHTPAAECEVWERAAEAVETLLPAPPTLAGMTREERDACQWMQCDVAGVRGRWALVTPSDEDGDAGLVAPYGDICWFLPERVTPRPDLPRMEWPGTEKPDPAPALPEGWRLADHEENGRVIVTTTPNPDGYVYFVTPAEGPMGYRWRICTPDELTYLDQEADQ